MNPLLTKSNGRQENVLRKKRQPKNIMPPREFERFPAEMTIVACNERPAGRN